MYVDAIHMDSLALNHTNAVVRAVQKVDVPNGETLAMVGEYMVRPLVAAQSARGWSAAYWRAKLEPLTIDCAWAFDGHILRLNRKEECPVPIIQRGIAAQRDSVDRVILLTVCGAKQL